MFGLLKKLQAKAQDLVLDLTKRDDMERAVFIGVSVAFADGTLETEEREMLPKIVARMFPNFEPGEISAVVRRAVEAHTISAELGFLETEQLLEGVESGHETKQLFAVGKAIAASDGEVEPDEAAILARFAGKLGFSLRDIGLNVSSRR